MASAFGTTYRFREPGTPGRVARLACLSSAAILSVTGIVAIMRGASDSEWQVRLFLPPEGSSAQPAFSTFYPGAIGAVVWIGSLAFLATAVCWLVWQARAHENVWAVPGLPAPTHKPGMAVIWWFIPFANLVMPYVCVRELATISAARAGSTPRRALPGVWWALFLAAAVASVVAAAWPWVLIVARVADAGDEVLGTTYVVDLSPVAWGIGVWHLILVAAALAGAMVVGDIERHQGSITGVAGGPTGPVPFPSGPDASAPPRPDLG